MQGSFRMYDNSHRPLSGSRLARTLSRALPHERYPGRDIVRIGRSASQRIHYLRFGSRSRGKRDNSFRIQLLAQAADQSRERESCSPTSYIGPRDTGCKQYSQRRPATQPTLTPGWEKVRDCSTTTSPRVSLIRFVFHFPPTPPRRPIASPRGPTERALHLMR